MSNVVAVGDTLTGKQYEVSATTNLRGTLLAEWIDTRSGNEQCAFSVSRDNGVTWSQNAMFKHAGYAGGVDPVVTSDAQGNLYVMCLSVEGVLPAVLDVSHSTDDGNTWSDWYTVPASLYSSPDKEWIKGGADGTIYMGVADTGQEPFSITFLKSTDYGRTWGARQVFTDPDRSLMGPFLDVDDRGTLYMAWAGYGSNVQITRSTDAGAHFTTPVTLGAAPGGGAPALAFVAVAPTGTDAYVASATAYGFDTIWLSQSHDGGSTWSAPATISSAGAEPSIAVTASGDVYLSWSEQVSGQQNHVVAVFSRDRGHTFSSQQILADSGLLNSAGENGSYQSLVVSTDGSLHQFWDDGRDGHPRIYTGKVTLQTSPIGSWQPGPYVARPAPPETPQARKSFRIP